MLRLILPIALSVFGLGLVSSAYSEPAATRAPRAKKVVFIAGRKSHGPGEHEYELGSRFLARCIETSPDLRGWRTEVHLYGWPENPETLNDADSIVVYCDGSDHSEADHPLLSGDRLQV